jgi:hypothetical protein
MLLVTTLNWLLFRSDIIVIRALTKHAESRNNKSVGSEKKENERWMLTYEYIWHVLLVRVNIAWRAKEVNSSEVHWRPYWTHSTILEIGYTKTVKEVWGNTTFLAYCIDLYINEGARFSENGKQNFEVVRVEKTKRQHLPSCNSFQEWSLEDSVLQERV